MESDRALPPKSRWQSPCSVVQVPASEILSEGGSRFLEAAAAKTQTQARAHCNLLAAATAEAMLSSAENTCKLSFGLSSSRIGMAAAAPTLFQLRECYQKVLAHKLLSAPTGPHNTLPSPNPFNPLQALRL